MDCLFCQREKSEILKESEQCFAIYDKYPVTNMHSLILPKRHLRHFFNLNKLEREKLFDFVEEIKTFLETTDPSIDGFNVGMNCEASAGQTIFHCHIHLIPRRSGDISEPMGGVRGVIPSKRIY